MYNSNIKVNQSPIRLHSWNYVALANWHWAQKQVPTSFWRCYLNDQAGALLRHGVKAIPMSPQKVYIIAPGTSFSCHSTQAFHQLYFHFTVEWSNIPVRNHIFALPVWEEAAKLLQDLAHQQKQDYRRDLLAALGFLHTALSKLPPSTFLNVEELDPRLRSILKSMNYTMIGHLNNRQLAKRAGMSENGFIRLFSKTFHKSPQQYYREQRIERACHMLRCSADSIEAIAAESGFADRYHFSRVFRQITGTTPAKYRRNSHTDSEITDNP
ncbi:MAG: helix-turn-helix domain-containing protein [Lentisphaerae bacterium]|nr:helix-turn-helix domain-containing protein [Lentisphaerota bacterium]